MSQLPYSKQTLNTICRIIVHSQDW